MNAENGNGKLEILLAGWERGGGVARHLPVVQFHPGPIGCTPLKKRSMGISGNTLPSWWCSYGTNFGNIIMSKVKEASSMPTEKEIDASSSLEHNHRTGDVCNSYYISGLGCVIEPLLSR